MLKRVKDRVHLSTEKGSFGFIAEGMSRSRIYDDQLARDFQEMINTTDIAMCVCLNAAGRDPRAILVKKSARSRYILPP